MLKVSALVPEPRRPTRREVLKHGRASKARSLLDGASNRQTLSQLSVDGSVGTIGSRPCRVQCLRKEAANRRREDDLEDFLVCQPN